MSDLMPCPICGSKGVMTEYESLAGRYYYVACNYGRCRLHGTPRIECMHRTEAEAAEAWNRRVACSECTERRGHYLDAETIQRQQERIRRLEAERDEWQLKCCEQAGLHASHVFRRDELVRDMALLLPSLKSECVRGCPQEAECRADDYAGGCRLYDRIEGGLRDAGIEAG